jgi:type I restriction enzyme S subunit
MNTAARVEAIAGERFNLLDFVENFEVIATAGPDLAHLRKLVVELAVRGRLSVPEDDDENIEVLLERVGHEVGERGAKYAAVGQEETPFSIPSHWRWVRWGHLALRTSSGWSPQCESRPRHTDEWGVLKVSAVSWSSFRPDENKALPKGIPPRPEFSVSSGDFLMSRANTADLVGRSVIVGDAPERLLLSDKIVRCEFSDSVAKQFVGLCNLSVAARAHYVTHASGTSDSMKNISREVILSMPIPLPPLAEQKRIVGKVDQLLALCDEIEARQIKNREVGVRFKKSALDGLTDAASPEAFGVAWEMVHSHLSLLVGSGDDVALLRNAIRGAACSGWLSARARRGEWGTGEGDVVSILKDRKVGRQCLLQQGARPSSLPPEERATLPCDAVAYVPPSWTICGVDDILACAPHALKAGPFGSALTKAMYVPSGFKVYGQEQVIAGDHTIGTYYVNAAKYAELKTCSVAAGDMLISLMGTVGRVLILPSDSEPGIINPRLLKLTLSSGVCAAYIKLYLEAPHARQFIQESARGVAMDGLNIGILRSLPILLPPYAEQKWIVSKVETLMNCCDHLEARFRQSQRLAIGLGQAVVDNFLT